MLDDIYSLSQTLMRVRRRSYPRSFLRTNPLDGRFIIVGPRGVGKTTVMIQHLLDRYDGDLLTQKALYIQADHFLVQRSSLYEIVDAFQKLGGEFVCIDEIHKYPSWSMELKSIIDTFPQVQVLASGSSALEIHKGSHDLSRRMLTLPMAGLSFREYLGMVHGLDFEPLPLPDLLTAHQTQAMGIVEAAEKHGHKILALFGTYLEHGYVKQHRIMTHHRRPILTPSGSVCKHPARVLCDARISITGRMSFASVSSSHYRFR